MIISKTERYANELALALHKLQSLVDTNSRSAEARAEARQLRDQVSETGVCPYCGEPITVWSVRRRDACADCTARLDRMLMTKSRLKAGSHAPDMLSRFKEDYMQLKYVPQNLGGSQERAEQIVQAIDDLQVAIAANKKAKLEVQRRNTIEALRNKRMDGIRADLVKLGADSTAKDFEDQVTDIYYRMYKDEF